MKTKYIRKKLISSTMRATSAVLPALLFAVGIAQADPQGPYCQPDSTDSNALHSNYMVKKCFADWYAFEIKDQTGRLNQAKDDLGTKEGWVATAQKNLDYARAHNSPNCPDENQPLIGLNAEGCGPSNVDNAQRELKGDLTAMDNAQRLVNAYQTSVDQYTQKEADAQSEEAAAQQACGSACSGGGGGAIAGGTFGP
jgi:hypothetical protein